MCEIDGKCDDNGNVSLTCKTSGKPISVATSLGLFCEDMCGMNDFINFMQKEKSDESEEKIKNEKDISEFSEDELFERFMDKVLNQKVI